MTTQNTPEDEWKRLRPDAEHALSNLLSEIGSHRDPQSLFDAYTYAKNITASAIRSRMLMHLPEENRKFKELHAELQQELNLRYSDTVPKNLLRTPYRGKTHERLFSLLQENFTQPVPAAMVRIVTGDGVHTERRARELRELGLDVESYALDEIDVYELRSLNLNFDLLPFIVKNNVRKTKAYSTPEKKRILRNAGIFENE
ncbi:hypothetical protein ACWD04_04830 [Streptomyces sp. NPDC002911]